MKRTRSDIVFDTLNTLFMLLLLVIMIYPLYFVLIASFSDPHAVARGEVKFFFSGFTFESYQFVFETESIWRGYFNSIVYTALGTLLNLALTLPVAYGLSKKALPGRSALSWFFLFTMYFSGGMIPTYLLVRDLGLINKPVTIIVLGGIAVYNMIVTRVFFQSSIPEELYEAARIDGASDFRQFFVIALPLSAPIIAVIALYYGVGRWNDYYTALIYVTDYKLHPLQMVLREILLSSQMALSTLTDPTFRIVDEEYKAFLIRRAYIAEAMKYSLIIVASLPLLIAYPFVQKYFVKGALIGSLKG